jgi:hypothetical protein
MERTLGPDGSFPRPLSLTFAQAATTTTTTTQAPVFWLRPTAALRRTSDPASTVKLAL